MNLFVTFGIILLLLFQLPSLSFALKKQDFQLWNYDSVSGSITPLVDFYADVEFRFKDNASTLYYNHEQIEFPIHVLSFLDISPCYRQLWVRDSEKKWIGISEPDINFILHTDVHRFHFYNRSRITYRIFYNGQKDVWQYRNKFGISKIFWRKPTEILLFVDDEFFLEQKQKGIYENRISLGMNIKIIKHLHFETGYRYRILRSGNFWTHDNILLLNLRGEF